MTDLPIRRVVLYKHGVGYFERETSVDGEQSLSLSFKQREVSDVLKSLTVLDLDGGTVAAVSYDSTTPVEQLLAEIALSIPDNGSLVGLLPQIKGARVSVKPTGGAAVQGAILGIDRTDERGDGVITHKALLALLTDAGDVRTFDLFDLELTLLDDSIKRDLDFYLKTQLASKKKDARTFTLFAQGEGARRVRVSYVLEAPVWKATYRILLDEPQPLDPASPPVATGGPAQPLIQGWAVVDNTSDEDWADVDLTLVAGLPVSFTHDLYTPRYIRRPVVEVKETTGVLPPIAEAGFDDAPVSAELVADGFNAPAASASRAKEREYVKAGAKSVSQAREMSSFSLRSAVSSAPAQTRERQLGDLFEYSIDKPVTVRRNQSALVPILLKPFAGRAVLLYQKAARAGNPIRCVEFENTTGLTLEGGPVTVLEAGSYVGEAMLDTLKPTEKRLVGYAVELAVRVTDSIDSHQGRVFRVVIHQGVMTTQYEQTQTTTYTFASKSDKEQVLYLDHPRTRDWYLGSDVQPHETTENYWRFRLPLPPHATTTFAVRAHRLESQQFSVVGAGVPQLDYWTSQKYLDATAQKAIRHLFAIQQRDFDLQERLKRIQAEREQIHTEQGRIRENLGALGDRSSEKELRERFVATLGRQEDRLAQIAEEEARLLTDRDTTREQLNAALAALDYDAAVPE